MLRSMNDLENVRIAATDGDIGRVKDFYFDDDAWAVRYFVVDTGPWLASRRVLISPIAVQQPDWVARTLPVTLTMEQVRNSPDIDADKPVSRQNEAQMLGYYGYPAYWGGEGMWGDGLLPYALDPGFAGFGVDHATRERELDAFLRDERARHRNDDPHLRSCKAVTGYHIHAVDGDIGHVAGFLVDDQTWAIRFLVVDTSNWWIGHEVLVAPQGIKGVNWSDRTVSLDFTRESIQRAPHYDPDIVRSHEQDLRLYSHLGRRGGAVDSSAHDSAT